MLGSFLTQEYRLWLLMVQTRDTIWAVRNRELAEYDLSNIEAAVLFIIQAIEFLKGKSAIISEISQWLFRKPHSVSELLSRMEKKGLVIRTKDTDKKSRVRITATEKGRHAYALITENATTVYQIMSILSEEEKMQLWNCLSKLREKALKEYGGKKGSPYFDIFPISTEAGAGSPK
jgi:DNA-binding MarR family transcriptional regulator